MPEVKNTFIQSKMNKDMDGRIIPNGQYRDGQNVQISRSEGDDVGALENVLGNELITTFGFDNVNLEIIGHLKSDTLDSIFLFLTDYTDSSPSTLDNNISGIAGECYIIQYNLSTNIFTILVSGNFLNFSKTHPVLGVTLIEELLFFTDYRNQPRKININLAQTGFYTTEDQISVAKYYPYEPISLLEEASPTEGRFQSSMKDKVSEYLPIHAAAKVTSDYTIGSNPITLIGQYTNIRPGSAGGIYGDKISGDLIGSGGTVSSVSINGSVTTITLFGTQGVNFDITDLAPGSIVYFQRQNPLQDLTWPGDPNYLKDKFARFSYRFKFIDGEYSLSAPFTQIAFVPEQDGYFIGNKSTDYDGDTSVGAIIGDEGLTIDSTIVGFMKNKINDIDLYIPAPTSGNNDQKYNFNQLNSSLNIIEIDILFKEASSNKTTIVDTLTLSDFGNLQDNFLKYNYQSRKPWKTLSPAQTTRVTDIVPVRAYSQASSGNRIIYGNFIDKHSSPINLNYTIQVNEKAPLPQVGDNNLNDRSFYTRKEYQNHTLKQNRTYQVGVVLSDRYGRQSNVILSSVINPTAPDQRSSTLYHRYKNPESTLLTDKYANDNFTQVQTADTWPGDMINATFNSIIPKMKTQDGYPGVYSIADGSVNSLTITFSPTFTAGGQWNPANNCTLTNVDFSNPNDPSQNGKCNVIFDANGTAVATEIVSSTFNFLNGTLVQLDFSQVLAPPGCDINDSPTSGTITCIVETTIDNPLGWYSYKFVIKQTEQEYYNVYLPTTLAGYPCNVTGVEATEAAPNAIPEFNYPNSQQAKVSHIVLYGDNINKIPKDLQEVGPTQELYRSSVKLYGRVNNKYLSVGGVSTAIGNVGFNPGSKNDLAVQVSTMSNLGLGDLVTNPATPIIPRIFYNGETNPIIGVVQTNKKFGITVSTCTPGGTPPNNGSTKYGTTLSVYETSPVESLLDIFWETTTSGLINDLNNKIVNEDNTLPVGITNPQLNWNESDGYNDIISGTFEAISAQGLGLGASSTIELISVIRGDNVNLSNTFELVEAAPGTGEYYIKIVNSYVQSGTYKPLFLCWADSIKNIYTFRFRVTKDDGINTPVVIEAEEQGTVQNVDPYKRDLSPSEMILMKTNSNLRYTNPSLTNIDIPFTKWNWSTDPATTPLNCFGTPGTSIQGDGYPRQNRAYGPIAAYTQWFATAAWRGVDENPTWRQGGNFDCPSPGNIPYMAGSIYPLAHSVRSDQPNYPPNCGSASPTGSTFETVATHPGTFGVYNGSYGSVPFSSGGPQYPPSNYNADEIVWTIPRMYQISTYGPLAKDAPGQFPSMADYIAGQEFIFGLTPTPAKYDTPCCDNPFCDDPMLGGWQGIKCLPKGPIYWHFSGEVPGFGQAFSVAEGANPTPGQMQAEGRVGALYNQGMHYWPDIQHLIENQVSEGLYPSLQDHPAMNLLDGANTFYQYTQLEGFWFADYQLDDGSYDIIPDPKKEFARQFWETLPTNRAGCKFYLGLPSEGGGNLAYGIGDPNNKRFRFNVKDVSNFDYLGPGGTLLSFPPPREAQIFAGDESVSGNNNFWLDAGAGVLDTWTKSDAIRQWGTSASGPSANGLSGGRYVVTLRATDRSALGGTQNFSGLITEFDIPIWIPPRNHVSVSNNNCT